MSDAPRLRVVALDFFERPVRLRLPFRFGVITLREAQQAFVRARVRLADGREGVGGAAEMLAPKWFDKDPALSNEDNFDQLRASLDIARDAYLAGGEDTAFGHFAAHYRGQLDACARRALNALVAGYGPALVDRAVLDAACRAIGASFQDAVRDNLPGIAPGPLAPDLDGFDVPAFLAARTPSDRIAVRHTVGLADPITAADAGERLDDGLPETLEEVIARYGNRCFKLKLGADQPANLDRLCAIARVLDARAAPYRVTLDGNEQFDDAGAVVALWRRMREVPELSRLTASVLFVEQPIARAHALARTVAPLAAHVPVIIDESDDRLEAWPEARALGYAGVSSKTCKGFYKSLLNAARCARWNARGERCFMSGEDLTVLPGLALQQDLALVSLLGIDHVERNGHHYVNGMAGAPESEQAAFRRAHPDLYERSHGAVRVAIRDGQVELASLRCPGFASAVLPDWRAMTPMKRGTTT